MHGKVVMSGIHTYGEVVHLFIEREDYSGLFMPGFEKWESDLTSRSETGLQYVDHCVGNVGWNQMNPWVKFYEDVMGFRNILTFDDKDISTEYSALMSKVMSNGNGFVKFPINEPAEGKKKSQVEEYLEFYNGEGVQHIAIATKNIVETVEEIAETRARVPEYSFNLLRHVARSRRSHRRRSRAVKAARHSGRSRRRRLSASDFHQAGGRSADVIFRNHPTQRREEFRQRKFQSAV